MFAWYTRAVGVAIYFFSHEAEKRKRAYGARGANYVHRVLFPYPLRITNLQTRFQLPYRF